MQPKTIEINGTIYQAYEYDGATYPAQGIPMYALRRVFNINVGQSKTIDFLDLEGFWEVVSVYISSTETAEVTVDILFENVSFYQDKFLRNETPRFLPPVLVDKDLTMRLTAIRDSIAVALIYLKPAHLKYQKDF